ncbi:leucine-rich repeat-containing protein 15-like [Asterias rubens]|uniref:leucine-rich repeat-containing protein 15-like n=1 Tax=Asterias rubens TaxID=7604 RepID=UPI001455AB50|nr:leucine-rich repeat-containing protein 15-like [Asterias rubens]
MRMEMLRKKTLLILATLHLVTAQVTMPHLCLMAYCRCDRRTREVSCLDNMFTEVPTEIPYSTRTLQLIGQNFTVLERISFTTMRSLRKLKLARDNIRRVMDDALSNVPKLKRLDMNTNFLERVPAPVSRMTSLKELILHTNHISSLEVTTFANLTQLQILDLDGNRIIDLPVGVFAQLWQLAILYLSNNSISTLSAEMFGNLSRLEELHLTHNRIQRVSPGWLSSMPNVWVLELGSALNHEFPDAGKNLLTTAGTDFLSNVERLVVSDNNLSEIPCEQFGRFPYLTHLDLSFNSIQGIPQACFMRLTRLVLLELNNNAITSLEYGDFFDSYSIWTLDLSGNFIEELPPGVFRGSSLGSLDLSFNSIRRLNNESFIALDYLMELFLSSNILDKLPKSAFRPLLSIDLIDLRWNHLTRITNQFSNMTTLTNLGLSRNSIARISPEAFQGCTNLRGLFLDSNRLSTVSEETFKLPNLVDVKLYDNPWHCDCRIKWMREAMSKPKKHPWMVYTDAQGVESYKGIVCASPTAFENISMFLIKDDETFRLICTSYVSPLAIEFIVGISFAIIASSTLCYVAKLYCKVREMERSGAETGKCLS